MADRVKLKLTEAQASALKQAAMSGSAIFYYSKRDVTMKALSRKGFAEWNSQIGSKYGKSFWWINDAGMDAGRALLASSGKTEE